MSQKAYRPVISCIWRKWLIFTLLVAGLTPILAHGQGSIIITGLPGRLPPPPPPPPLTPPYLTTPENDNFTNATELDGIYLTVQGTNVGATAEAGEPASHSVWWKWTAPENGIVELQTKITRGPFLVITPIFPTPNRIPFDSPYPPPGVTPQIALNANVYTGDDVADLTPVVQTPYPVYEITNVYAPSITRFNAVAGQTYCIALDSAAEYEFELTLTFGQIQITEPSEGTELVAGHPVQIEFSAFDTNVQLSSIEAFVGSNSLGVVTSPPFSFSFTPTDSGLVSISAMGANALGEQVQALVDTFIVAPGNDNFADATVIPGNWSDGTFSGNTAYATSEPGEPDPLSLSGPTVWWRWTPSSLGEVSLSIPSSTRW